MKKLLSLLMLMLLLPAAALAETQVVDDAMILTAEEEERITKIIDTIEARAEVDIVVLTTRDTPVDNTYDMRYARDFADDYFDYNGYGRGTERSGMLFLVDMHNRIMWLSTSGSMIQAISDDEVDAILDAAYNAVSNGDYASGIVAGMKRTARCLYNWLSGIDLLIAAAGGAAVAAVILLSVKGSYNLKGSTYAYALQQNSDFTMTRDDEAYLRQTVTRMARSTGSSGSGGGHSGGSSHRSSSGRSHGGGGRRF